jgi:hypothetical protein
VTLADDKKKYAEVDASDFFRRTQAIAKETGANADTLMFRTGQALLRRAKDKAPIDLGSLRASGGVYGDRRREEPPASHAGTREDGTTETVDIDRWTGDVGPGEVAVAFTVRHAAPVHEDTDAFHPQGEAKYLENRLPEVTDDLLRSIARGILEGA